jgi:hypothetical protein
MERKKAIDLENRLTEMSKKSDEHRRAYFKSREEREKLRQDLDKYR